MKWLAKYDTEACRRNMRNIPEYGRIDDLYCLVDTPLESEMFAYLKELAAEGLEELKNV